MRKVNLTTLMNECCDDIIRKHQEQLEFFRFLRQRECEFRGYFSLYDLQKTTKSVGVYFITNLADDQIMYVGQGNIGKRISVHRSVFENKGETVLTANSSYHSAAGQKMYNHDTDIDNWAWAYVLTHDKSLAERMETRLVEAWQTPFNASHMCGV